MLRTLSFFLIVAASGASAENYMFINGPKGCSYFDGLGGDGAAFHALDEDHALLDLYMLESTSWSCQLKEGFDLRPAPGKTETSTGTCETFPDGETIETTFTLTYLEGVEARLDVGDRSLIFIGCVMP